MSQNADVPLFEPLGHEPAYRRLSAVIERRIVSRSLREGEALPAETDLARQFGVNRSTVREALRNLESAGLVARRRGSKRLFVSRPATETIVNDVSRALLLRDVTPRDVWEAMMLFEPEMAALAALRRRDEDLERIAALHAALASSAAGDARSVELVSDFFQALGHAARNPVLTLAEQPLSRLLAPSLARLIDQVPQARRRILDAQRKILAALRARDDGEARRWMQNHVRDFQRGYEIAGIAMDEPVSRNGEAVRG